MEKWNLPSNLYKMCKNYLRLERVKCSFLEEVDGMGCGFACYVQPVQCVFD